VWKLSHPNFKSNIPRLTDWDDRYFIPWRHVTKFEFSSCSDSLFTRSRLLLYSRLATDMAYTYSRGNLEEGGGKSMNSNNNWSWEVFFDAFPVVLEGLGITITLTIACYLFALLFGFVCTFLRRISNQFIHWIVTWVMEFIRSTPPLVQLFFLFYAWPMVPKIGMTLSPFTSAVLGLGIHYSTYIAEVYRSGIEGVDKGQWEASTALNLTTRQKWLKIILPQAIPPTIPMLGNYLII